MYVIIGDKFVICHEKVTMNFLSFSSESMLLVSENRHV